MKVEVIKAKGSKDMISERVRGKYLDRLRVCAYCRVSTDTEDQLSSYRSQVSYYTDLIKKNKEWVFVDIYADEGITGTAISKRESFQRMINDCMDGKIDMVITKSISRFARNTLDTLNYVRKLKERGIAVFFEEEKINTLTMDGELLLVVLSSVAQQEVENISANVKKGLKMKMRRGELVGFHGCLGYDYNPIEKNLTINEKEVEVVRYIFERYVNGAGTSVISKELNNLEYKTKKGNQWTSSSVLGIIKNEKYKGDLLLGKTFTIDPISKRRLGNCGEEDQYYIKDHHEPIISNEMFDRAQEILSKRAYSRRIKDVMPGKREKFSRQYAFSCMLECCFCGSNFSRRNWHSGTPNEKVVWQCVTNTKKGKMYCPDSKGISEKVIEDAFIEAYRLLNCDNKEIMTEFIERVKSTLSDKSADKKLNKIDRELEANEKRKSRLIELLLEDVISKNDYEEKNYELGEQRKKLLEDRVEFQSQADNRKSLERRVIEFQRALEGNQVLSEFDRAVFESIVEKVIVGEIDENGMKDPYKLTFVFKTGISSKIDINDKVKQKKKNLCSFSGDEDGKICSYVSDNTCGDGGVVVKKK